MQYFNGKLVTEHPENPACVIHKLDQVLEKSENLQLTLTNQINNQNSQINSLKLSLVVLENKLKALEKENLVPMKSSLNILTTQLPPIKSSLNILTTQLPPIKSRLNILTNQLPPMKSSLNILITQVTKKYLNITITTVVGFMIIWLSLIIHGNKTENKPVNHGSTIELQKSLNS